MDPMKNLVGDRHFAAEDRLKAFVDQEGRLFKPLAYTKTFAMLFSSFLAVTLTPVLMTLFIRGKIRPEEKKA